MSSPAVSTSTRSQQPSFGQEGLVAASDNLVQFISFAIGDDQYGVDIMAVREIKGGPRSPICRSSPNTSAAF